jgi:hypothetical protein
VWYFTRSCLCIHRSHRTSSWWWWCWCFWLLVVGTNSPDFCSTSIPRIRPQSEKWCCCWLAAVGASYLHLHLQFLRLRFVQSAPPLRRHKQPLPLSCLVQSCPVLSCPVLSYPIRCLLSPCLAKLPASHPPAKISNRASSADTDITKFLRRPKSTTTKSSTLRTTTTLSVPSFCSSFPPSTRLCEFVSVPRRCHSRPFSRFGALGFPLTRCAGCSRVLPPGSAILHLERPRQVVGPSRATATSTENTTPKHPVSFSCMIHAQSLTHHIILPSSAF